MITSSYDPFILMASLDHLILQRNYDKVLLVVYHDEKTNADSVDYRYSNTDDAQKKYEIYRKKLIKRYVDTCNKYDDKFKKKRV